MVAHRPRLELRVDGGALRDEIGGVECLEKVRKTTNAITHFNVLDRRNDAALVECCSVTGRSSKCFCGSLASIESLFSEA